MTNSPMLRVVEFGVLLMGSVRVALSPRLNVREIVRIAGDCAASAICCDPQNVAGVRSWAEHEGVPAAVMAVDDTVIGSRRSPECGPELDASGPAMLLYTSGTTGMPKGASVSHAAWLRQMTLALEQLPPLSGADRVLAVAPMAHFGGSIAIDAALAGASTIVHSKFDPRVVLETVVTERVTVLPLAPIMVSMLVESAPAELVTRAARQLRAIPYGGSPLPVPRLLTAARAFPGLLHQYYGLSETLAPVSALSAADHDRAVRAVDDGRDDEATAILSSAGFVARDTEVRIDPGHGGGPGLVSVRSPLVTSGYWSPGGVLRSATDEDGWFATGDLGSIDGDGRLRLHGRDDDVIITGGYNVVPAEVESVIRTVAGVVDVAVVGVPDRTWGERVHATLVLAVPGPALADVTVAIERACRTQIASYKRPLSFDVVDELPRTALDKVDRAALRRRLAQ